MGKNSKIAWTHHTFNGWRGCETVSPACDNCYAWALSKRNPATLGTWGPEGVGTRVVGAEEYWSLPAKWDREAAKAGVRERVFALSLADVFEHWRGPMLDVRGRTLATLDGGTAWFGRLDDVALWIPGLRPLTMADVRSRLFDLIDDTPNLDWLLLTKRPENMEAMLPWTSDHAGEYRERYWHNVWLGTTVEDRKHGLPRIDLLRNIPAAVRYLSVEPLLEDLGDIDLAGIHWVIVGGESGPHARPCDLAWVRNVVRQCADKGVACFVKQLGDRPGEWREHAIAPGSITDRAMDSHIAMGGAEPDDEWIPLRLVRAAGADPAEWPEDLRVRELPTAGREG
jgi:protein gp37